MKLLGVVVLFFISCSATAEPVVIFDSGNTTPIDGALPDQKQSVLPVVSQLLSVGVVEKQKVNFPVKAARPICVIGSDHFSLTWIKSHLRILMSLNTICYLVQAESVSDLKAVADITGDLFVFPTNGDFLRDLFDIDHYPVLISASWIEQ